MGEVDRFLGFLRRLKRKQPALTDTLLEPLSTLLASKSDEARALAEAVVTELKAIQYDIGHNADGAQAAIQRLIDKIEGALKG